MVEFACFVFLLMTIRFWLPAVLMLGVVFGIGYAILGLLVFVSLTIDDNMTAAANRDRQKIAVSTQPSGKQVGTTATQQEDAAILDIFGPLPVAAGSAAEQEQAQLAEQWRAGQRALAENFYGAPR